ncbi:hypothetical protein [Rheinheimera hassiensis]|uniref:hypothetical protein n=1 Tax=Rheinheimera hassiensis TaxID=1193627 RepID=UPI001F06E244|nr:hypothetical protein [Rheinheimera hassiensis]
MKTKVIEFINSIGIETKEHKGAAGFIPGVLIEEGRLLYDLEIASIADLLHEAGHLAITPLEYRSYMSKGLMAGLKFMLDSIEREFIEPDSPLFRAIIQCSDTEATAWAYAAGVHLGLPPNKIIDSASYDGTGDEILLSLQLDAYSGVNGLHHAGMCVRGRAFAAMRGTSPYPHMQRWTQPKGLSKIL